MEKVELLEKANLIKLKRIESWDLLVIDKNILFSYLTSFLLKEENLFYYASQRSSTTTLFDTKKNIKKLIELNILDQEINSVLKSIGWDKDIINIENTVFQGDLAEYLMCILIDNYLEIKTIISKISLKTSPNVPSFGNDNIFYDFHNNIFYYGESKFYSNTSAAIDRAFDSLEKHSDIQEISFIKSHTNVTISQTGEERNEVIEKLETIASENFTIKSVIFIVSDDVNERNAFEQILKTKDYERNEIILVFLPIISKEEFLIYFKESLV